MPKPVKKVVIRPWKPKRPAADANLRARRLMGERLVRVVSVQLPREAPKAPAATPAQPGVKANLARNARIEIAKQGGRAKTAKKRRG